MNDRKKTKKKTLITVNTSIAIRLTNSHAKCRICTIEFLYTTYEYTQLLFQILTQSLEINGLQMSIALSMHLYNLNGFFFSNRPNQRRRKNTQIWNRGIVHTMPTTRKNIYMQCVLLLFGFFFINIEIEDSKDAHCLK